MSDTPRTDSMMKFCFGTDQEYIRLADAVKLERELTEAKRDAARYQVVRKMSLRAFMELHSRCLVMDLRFDDEVDKIGGLK